MTSQKNPLHPDFEDPERGVAGVELSHVTNDTTRYKVLVHIVPGVRNIMPSAKDWVRMLHAMIWCEELKYPPRHKGNEGAKRPIRMFRRALELLEGGGSPREYPLNDPKFVDLDVWHTLVIECWPRGKWSPETLAYYRKHYVRGSRPPRRRDAPRDATRRDATRDANGLGH